MIESLADIEALAISCRSDQSRDYITEALRCYRSGAFRAAIVSAWIATVFDLIDKIRELALTGDAAAKTLDTQYENYVAQIEKNNVAGIKAGLEYERTILETCRDKLQFFDPQQFVDLNRLREDRHRCAHPSFQRIGVPYYPSAEQARVHIRNAIVYVLAQPPVQGKAALAELKALVSSAYFPTDHNKAKEQLANSGFKNATDALVRGFVDQLVFAFLTDGDPLFLKSQVVAAINGSAELYPAIVEERLRKQINKAIRDVPDKTFSGATTLAAFVNGAWQMLEPSSREKLTKFILTGPYADVLDTLEPFSQFAELAATLRTRIGKLTLDQLSEVIERPALRDLAKDRALELLSEVKSWDRANEVFARAVLPLFAMLSADDVQRVIRMPKETSADLIGAHGYKLFIDNVRKVSNLDEAPLNALLTANGAGYLVPQTEEDA